MPAKQLQTILIIITLTVFSKLAVANQDLQPCPTVCPDGSRPYFCVCPVTNNSRPPVVTNPNPVTKQPTKPNCSRMPSGSSDCPPVPGTKGIKLSFVIQVGS
ncbi:hypothetical protein TI04_04840 [Achromatium sp. WMS2]|nr:hypothetical protein TI04_04840 [Achromatium sp. WMS2]